MGSLGFVGTGSLRLVRVCSALAVVGCGNAVYAMRSGQVSSQLRLAEQAGASESAPYEYYFADEHLQKARSEAAESDFGDALTLLSTAGEYARLASDVAARGAPRVTGPGASARKATSGRKIPREIARLEQVAATAELSGARRCAPRELAIGRSQLEFAAVEDAQGCAPKASEHLRAAEQNIQAARLASSAPGCSDINDKTRSLESNSSSNR